MNQELKEKVAQYFEDRKEAIVRDIMRLIRIKSVAEMKTDTPPFGEGCIKVLHDGMALAEEMGFSVKNLDNYAALIRDGAANPTEEIAIMCHLDVVAEGEGWTHAPYDPYVENGYIIGRGACDDKGPAVVALYLLQCVRDLHIQLKHPLMVFFGTCEETGMKDEEYYLSHEPAPKFGLVADTVFPVNNGEKGMLFLKLKSREVTGNILECQGGTADNVVPDRAYVILQGHTAQTIGELGEGFVAENVEQGVSITAMGISTHGSSPEKGANAIGLLFAKLMERNLVTGTQREVAAAIAEICADYNGKGLGIPVEDAVSGKITHVMGTIRLSDKHFEMGCNARYPVTVDNDRLIADLKGKISSYQLEEISLKNVKPSYISADDPIIEALMEVYRENTGDTMKAFVSGGGTYARMLPQGVGYGMAYMKSKSPFGKEKGSLHQPDECVKIEELLQSAKIYIEAILKIDTIL